MTADYEDHRLQPETDLSSVTARVSQDLPLATFAVSRTRKNFSLQDTLRARELHDCGMAICILETPLCDSETLHAIRSVVLVQRSDFASPALEIQPPTYPSLNSETMWQ
jgi:hypothetical protein